MATAISLLTTGATIALEIIGLPKSRYINMKVYVLTMFLVTSSPFPYSGCFLYDMSPIFPYAWLPPFVSETVLCALIMYKTIVLYFQDRRAPILRVIYRDRYE